MTPFQYRGDRFGAECALEVTPNPPNGALGPETLHTSAASSSSDAETSETSKKVSLALNAGNDRAHKV